MLRTTHARSAGPSPSPGPGDNMLQPTVACLQQHRHRHQHQPSTNELAGRREGKAHAGCGSAQQL